MMRSLTCSSVYSSLALPAVDSAASASPIGLYPARCLANPGYHFSFVATLLLPIISFILPVLVLAPWYGWRKWYAERCKGRALPAWLQVKDRFVHMHVPHAGGGVRVHVSGIVIRVSPMSPSSFYVVLHVLEHVLFFFSFSDLYSRLSASGLWRPSCFLTSSPTRPSGPRRSLRFRAMRL